MSAMDGNKLDDFFLKKDRKKKSKSASGGSGLAGVGDADSATGKKKKSRSKPKNTSQNSGEEKREDTSGDALSAVRGAVPQEEEWNDYAEEKEPDLSGLRIQNVQLAGKREEDESKEDQDEEGEEGDDVTKSDQKETSSGPWNKISMPPAPVVQQVAPEPMPEPMVEEARTPGKYVPPNMRGLGSSAATKPISARRTKKTAPDMSSTEDFPTLGKGPMPQARPAGNQYSQDNDGTSHVFQRKGPELTLENKYSALQE